MTLRVSKDHHRLGRKTCRGSGITALWGGIYPRADGGWRHTKENKMTKLDIDFVRAHFPAFEAPLTKGQAFFENAGGSYPCRQVVDRLHRF